MKKQIFLLYIFCVSIFSIAKSQSTKRYVYYMDNNFSIVQKSKAVILGEGSYENGAFKLTCYSINRDKLLLTAYCTDSSLSQFNGMYTSFHLNGSKEEEGNYKNGNREGTWQKWDSLQRKVDSTIYVQDQPILSTTYSYHKNGVLYHYTSKDSLLDTYSSIYYTNESVKSSEVFFKGQNGIVKTFTENGIQTDTVFTRAEIESDFKGGLNGWITFLQRNINPKVPKNQGAPPGNYQVFVQFIVQKDGSIGDIAALTSYGFGMEEEVIRVVKKSPKWVPAVQYGRIVKSYKKQPIYFIVE